MQRAACSETDKPIVLYASDKAMQERPLALSEALRIFVKLDNRLFRQELIEESPREKKRSCDDGPSSPSKRQLRESSIDSVATNRASAGDLGERDELSNVQLGDFATDDVFSNPEGPLGTEMVQLAVPGRPVAPSPSLPPPDGGQDGAGEVSYFADWDNPEGRPGAVPPARIVLDE